MRVLLPPLNDCPHRFSSPPSLKVYVLLAIVHGRTALHLTSCLRLFRYRSSLQLSQRQLVSIQHHVLLSIVQNLGVHIYSKEMFIRTLCVSKNLNWVRLRKHFLVVALE